MNADMISLTHVSPADTVSETTDTNTGNTISDALEELRLDPIWLIVRAAAVSQALARCLAERVGVTFNADTLSVISSQIWTDRGVNTPEDLAEWMQERRVDERRVRALVCSEAVRRWGEQAVSSLIPQNLVDQLQLSAEYPRLRARASDKRAQLALRGLLDLPNAVDINYQELLTWWAHHRPHLAPSQLANDAERDPFANASQFRRAMINEYHYVTQCHAVTAAPPEPSSGRLSDADMVSRPIPWS